MTFRRESGTECVCKDEYYNVVGELICKKCNWKCKTCTSETVCTSCKENRVGPKCDPAPGFWENNNENVVIPACHYSCLKCFGSLES